MPQSFQEYARQIGPKIEAALEEAVSVGPGCPEILQEAMHYALLSPGKRIRPMLVLLATEACGADVQQAMPAACAVEMVHAYSLVHDDLPAMDNDDLRRGRPTCHKVFGEALAILAGDALLTLAFETLSKRISPPERAARCCAVLAEAAGWAGMAGGQVDDLIAQKHPSLPPKVLCEEASLAGSTSPSNSPSYPNPGEIGSTNMVDFAHSPAPEKPPATSALEYLESIHRRKTGAMILASLRLGALVASAPPDEESILMDYGRCLGLAFQIVDDLLDVRGDESAVGKRLRKDAAQGKLTFPSLLGVEESLRWAERLVGQAIQALGPMGQRAARLQALAQYVLQRSR